VKKLKGIRRKRDKWEAYVRVAGRLHTKTFDDLDVAEMRAWQERQRSTVAPTPGKGTLAEKAAAYFALPEVAARPQIGTEEEYLRKWLDKLGWDTLIDAITRDQVEQVIQQWLKEFAEATVYHRRSALLAVFKFAYGKHGRNVVLDTTVPAAWTPRDQSVDYATLAKILDTMPTERRPSKGIVQPSAARLVSAVLMHTGVRGGDLVQVRRNALNWQLGTMQMPASGKGRGVPPWTCVLTPEGLEAMRAFDAANLYGAFNPAAVSRSFKRACRRVLGRDTPVHLYSLRHSVGADALRASGDYVTVGHLLGHAEGSRMSEQYAQGARAEVDRRTVVLMGNARRASLGAPARAPKRKPLDKKLVASRKVNKRSKLRRVS
jgi:integrase